MSSISNMDLVPGEVLEELKALDVQLGRTKQNLESLLEPVLEISKELAKSATSYKKLTDTINKLDEAEKKAVVTFKEQDKAMSEVQKLQKKLIELSSEEAKEAAKLKEQIRQKNKENRESAKAMLEEAAAAEKLAQKLNGISEKKSVDVSVTTTNENKTVSSGDNTQSVVQSAEQLEAAFKRIAESGFADISGMLKANEAGMVDYSGAINAVSERLAYVQSLQESFEASLEAGQIGLDSYNQKMQVLHGVQEELQQSFIDITEAYSRSKAESDNVSFSTDSAAEAFCELSERAQELTRNLIELNSEQASINGALKELESAYAGGAVSEEAYIQQKAELTTMSKNNAEVIRNTTRELGLEVKVANSAAGSYDNLSARYSLLKMKLNAMSGAGKENTEEFRNMQEEAKNLYEEMKNLQSATGKEQLNVGNYGELPEWLEDTIGGLSQVPGAAGAAAGGFQSVGAAAKALLANPIVALIAGIVAVLSTLFSAFKKSETGSRLLEKAGNALSAVMMAITGIAEKLAKGIKSLFDDPKAALESFAEKFKQMFMDRIRAAASYVLALKDAAVALFHLDFDKVGESLKKAGDSLLKFTTGIGIADIKKGVEEFNSFTDAVERYHEALNKLQDDRLAAKKANEALTRQIADLSVEEAKYSTIAQDASRSQEERLEAENKAYAAVEKRAKAEYQIAKTNFDLAKRELKLHKDAGENVDELETKYTEAYSAMRQAEQQYITEREKNQQRVNNINLQNAAKEIDILAETTSNQIAVNLRKVKSDENTYEERKRILDASAQMLENSLSAELGVVQGYASERIDINSLLNEDDQRSVNERIQAMNLPVQMEEKLLKIIKDYRQQKQNLNDADVASEKKRVDDVLKEINREASARGRDIATDESKANTDLSKEYASGLMSEEVYQAKKKAIADKYTMERFEAEGKALQDSLNVVGLTEDQKLKIKEQIANKEVELTKWKDAQEIASTEALAEKKKELLQEAFEFANQLVEQQFEAKLEKLEQESEENEAWAEEEKERIERLEESGAISKEQAEARKALVDDQARAREEEIEQKKKEVLKKQAIYEKAKAVMQVALSTGMSIAASAQMGFPAAIPFIAMAAALGAVQTAAVLATPIPEYARGTQDHPGGLALVGDGGRSELVIANGMFYKTPSTDTLVDLPKHSVVLPDFRAAMSGLPTLPIVPEKENMAVDFSELSGLMKDSNDKLGKIVVSIKKSKKNGAYGAGLFNAHKFGV